MKTCNDCKYFEKPTNHKYSWGICTWFESYKDIKLKVPNWSIKIRKISGAISLDTKACNVFEEKDKK